MYILPAGQWWKCLFRRPRTFPITRDANLTRKSWQSWHILQLGIWGPTFLQGHLGATTPLSAAGVTSSSQFQLRRAINTKPAYFHCVTPRCQMLCLFPRRNTKNWVYAGEDDTQIWQILMMNAMFKVAMPSIAILHSVCLFVNHFVSVYQHWAHCPRIISSQGSI